MGLRMYAALEYVELHDGWQCEVCPWGWRDVYVQWPLQSQLEVNQECLSFKHRTAKRYTFLSTVGTDIQTTIIKSIQIYLVCILIPICVFCCKSKQKKKKGHSASIPEKNSIKYTAHTKFIAFNNLHGILCVTPPPPQTCIQVLITFTSWNFFMTLLNIPKLALTITCMQNTLSILVLM